MDFRDAFKVVVDDQAPPGGVFLRSGLEQAVIPVTDPAAVLRRAMADPLKAPLIREDLLSLAESADFIVRMDEASEPIRCESCGTMVVAVPESPADGMVRWDERRWSLAIWEDALFRKHTLRRCEWQRGDAARSLVD